MTEIICLAVGFFCGFLLAGIICATRAKKLQSENANYRRIFHDYGHYL